MCWLHPKRIRWKKECPNSVLNGFILPDKRDDEKKRKRIQQTVDDLQSTLSKMQWIDVGQVGKRRKTDKPKMEIGTQTNPILVEDDAMECPEMESITLDDEEIYTSDEEIFISL